MHLIQLLLPIRDNAGQPYEEQVFRSINATLVKQFGGVTAFSRAPAKGTWLNADHEERDDVIVVEVMAEGLDRGWWHAFREGLEADMGQAEVVVRCHAIERLLTGTSLHSRTLLSCRCHNSPGHDFVHSPARGGQPAGG